jgi:hypothetical protein
MTSGVSGMVVGAPVAPVGVRHARLARYGLWQLRDYLMDRGTPTFIVAMLFGYFTLSPMLIAARVRLGAEGATRGSAAAHAAMMEQMNYMFLRSFLGTLVFVGALFAMNGIVANDRKLGFYRFLFAKPVAPSRYYGQAFLIHWAGFLGVMTLLGVIYGYLVSPVLSGRLMTVVALTYLCYAGIAFMLSAAARWDWLSLVAVSVGATFLWGKYGDSAHPLAKLLYLLPPVHRTDEIYASIATTQSSASQSLALPWHSIWWLAGYGAASFLVGLLVLRHRRLAIV